MKTFAILSIFIAAAAAATVCFPEEFTTDQVTFDPAREDIFGSKIWYSQEMQGFRVDVNVVIIDNNNTGMHESFLANYNTHKFYHIMYNHGAVNCTVATLNQNMEPMCLSKNAEHRGTIVLGGVLTCENYIERKHEDNSHVIRDILFVENINVPIRSLKRDANGMKVDEFWNFEEKVHHDAFVVPSACQSAEVVKAVECPRKYVKEAHPELRDSLIFNL